MTASADPRPVSDPALFMDRAIAALAAQALSPVPDAAGLLPLYFADGLLEALEWAHDGVASDEAACLWLAGLRWYRLATGAFPDGAPEPRPRWIDALLEGTPVRIGPASESLTAGLGHEAMGTAARPHDASADSPAVLAPAAVSAFLPHVTPSTAARFAADASRLTHGSPSAAAAAASAAELLARALTGGPGALESGLDPAAAAAEAGAGPAHDALHEARAAAAAGCSAFDAGRGAVGAWDAVREACAHGETDPGTTAMARMLLGGALGTAALPDGWEARLPAAAALREWARRWSRLVFA
ncbi:hypothetical protein ACQ3I4_03910 [Zafaria sp. Z1313]|uniref:hypothetical protein n=1 Tax=Zafaria sp. Z1313 TaxID=3423202 RepID=UPI003D302AA1